MSVETMARLAKHKNIVGVKDATANLARPLHTRARLRRGFLPAVRRGSHRAVAFLAAGGRRLHQRHRQRRAAAVQRDARPPGQEGRVAEAMAIQNRLVPLHDALFAETSPAR